MCKADVEEGTRCTLALINDLHAGRNFSGMRLYDSRLWTRMRDNCPLVRNSLVSPFMHPANWDIRIPIYLRCFKYHVVPHDRFCRVDHAANYTCCNDSMNKPAELIQPDFADAANEEYDPRDDYSDGDDYDFGDPEA